MKHLDSVVLSFLMTYTFFESSYSFAASFDFGTARLT